MMSTDESGNYIGDSGQYLYNFHKNEMGAPLNVFLVGGNLVYKQMLASKPNQWGLIRLANGYVQALQISMQQLTASQIALGMNSEYFNEFFTMSKRIFQSDEERFPAIAKFLLYWESRLPEIQRYLNLS